MADWKAKKNMKDVGFMTYDFEWVTTIDLQEIMK